MGENQNYSHAFESLVKSSDDIAGMVAYCRYKKQKKEFCQKNNLARDSDQVINYHSDLNQDRIDGLREAALVIVQRYSTDVSNQVLQQEKDRLLRDVIAQEMTTIAHEVTAVAQEVTTVITKNTSWWRSILYSAVGGAFLGFVIVGMTYIGFMNPFSAMGQGTQANSTEQNMLSNGK